MRCGGYSAATVACTFDACSSNTSPRLCPYGALLESTVSSPTTIVNQLVSRSDAMMELRQRLIECAQHTQPVLLCGPCGVGKSWVASLLHQMTRPQHPCEIVVCEDLAHEPEAWSLRGIAPRALGTGEQNLGAFQRTQSGTLVFEWLDKLSNIQQGALLSVLAHKRYHRYGETSTRAFQGRVIATLSHVPTSGAICIRQELLARFGENVLVIPTLADREADFPELVQLMLRDMGSSCVCQPPYNKIFRIPSQPC